MIDAEAGAQGGEFFAAGEVGRAVAAEHIGKYAEMRGYAAGDTYICTGGEIDRPAFAALLAQILEQLAVIGQVLDVECDVVGDEGLECGLALQDAGEEHGYESGARACQDEERVNERVGLDQGSVKIDAEGPRGWVELCGVGGRSGGWVGHGVCSRSHGKYTVALRRSVLAFLGMAMARMRRYRQPSGS